MQNKKQTKKLKNEVSKIFFIFFLTDEGIYFYKIEISKGGMFWSICSRRESLWEQMCKLLTGCWRYKRELVIGGHRPGVSYRTRQVSKVALKIIDEREGGTAMK